MFEDIQESDSQQKVVHVWGATQKIEGGKGMKRILSLIVCFAVLFSTSLGLFSTSLPNKNANRILQVPSKDPRIHDPHVFSGNLSM